MESTEVCRSCPHSDIISLTTFLSSSDEFNQMVASVVSQERNVGEKMKQVFMFLALSVFGSPEAGVQSDTLWAVHQCLESIWNLGNRGINCQNHHMRDAYEAAGRGALCLRKYMMEESINFIKGLWKESNKNEEQFQALLRDRWSVHQMAFMC